MGSDGLFGDSLGSERLFGLRTSKLSLLLSDAAYDLGFGRFGFSFRPCELEARWPALLISDAAYDLGLGRSGSSGFCSRPSGL